MANEERSHAKVNCKKNLQEVISSKLEKEAYARSIPEELNKDIASLNAAKDDLAVLKAQCEEASAEEKSLSIQCSDADQEVNNYQAQVETLTVMREYEAMQKQIAEARAKYKSLLSAKTAKNEEIKELSLRIEEQQEVCDALQAKVDEESSSVECDLKEVNDQIQELEDQINSIRGDILTNEEFDKLYSIAKKKGGRGLVEVKGHVCTGCNTVLPVQFVIDLRIAQELEDKTGTCPYCSREIFFNEEISDEDEKKYNFDPTEVTKASFKQDSSKGEEADEDTLVTEDDGYSDVDDGDVWDV